MKAIMSALLRKILACPEDGERLRKAVNGTVTLKNGEVYTIRSLKCP